MPLNAAMANGPIVRVVTATAILAILQMGLADAAYRDDENFSSPEDDIRDRLYISPSKTCMDKYEIKTKKIIRTEDSLSNEAVFLNAVITENHQDCLHTCCGYEDGTCDTTIYIQGDGGSDENCFLFRCWFDDEQRCLFSSHDGYVISMMGGFENPRFSQNTDETHLVPPEHYNSDPVSSEEHDVAISPKKTTISPSTTTKTHFSTPATDVKTYKKPTNAPKRPVDEQVCTSMQYKCPRSRECILKRLLCDKIVDCTDGSDEHDCEPAGKRPLTSNTSSKVKIDKSQDEMYEDEMLPESVDESMSYFEEEGIEDDGKIISDNDKFHKGSFQLYEPNRDQASSQSSSRHKVLEKQNVDQEDDDEDVNDGNDGDGQQDIQHLRSLAEKQKNRNDLLSMRDKMKEISLIPSHVRMDDIDEDGEEEEEEEEDLNLLKSRCPSGRCRPIYDDLDDAKPDPSNDWDMRDNIADGNREYRVGTKNKDMKPRIQPILDYDDSDDDDGDDNYQTGDVDNQYHYPRKQQRINNVVASVTQPSPRSQVHHSKPHHGNSLVRHGSVVSQYSDNDDDFPEQRYTDDSLLERENAGRTYDPQTKEDLVPLQRNDHNAPSQVKQDSRRPTGIGFKQRQGDSPPSKSNFRNSAFDGLDTKQHPLEKVTTEQPMQWLGNKEPPVRIQSMPVSDVLKTPASDRVLKPEVDSDYFPNWNAGISLFYDDSYNVGEDWDDNWRNEQMTKDMPRHNDKNNGWYNSRYDDDDGDQYGYYQPRQRNGGNDRLPTRGRNRYPDHGRPKTDKMAKHRDRNRGGDVEEGGSSRRYQQKHQEQISEERQDPVKDESQQIPSSHSVVTMASPESPQHKDGIQGNSIDSTLPPNPPPPTHLAESSQNDHQDKGDSKPKAKGPVIVSVSRDRAGQVEIPTGALFPLVVGLLLTMFLVMMVGCRLRYMNRRLRYGRMKTNAHDADYLINGMYL